MVVDDDHTLLQLVRILLGRLDVSTVTTDNATTAGQLLRTGPTIDLLILDLMMPDVSGMDFLHQLRADPIYNDLPILILSALMDPEAIRLALDAGADRYLTKSYIPSNLPTVVQDMLRTGRRHE